MMYFFRLKSFLLPVLLIGVFILASGCQRQEGNKPAGSQPVAEVNRDIPLTNENAYETVLRELQEDPNNTLALYHLGDLYFRDGKYDKAVENFQKVVAADPSRGYVYFQMGTALSRLGRLEEALDAFTHAVTKLKGTTVAVAYNNMGIAYGRLGRYQEEIEAMKKAIQHRPRYASARYNWGVTLIKIGDLEGAREQYEALNKFDLTIAKALLKEIEKAAPAKGAR
jgi:tetratricopeptide (TPR) repeat protein